MSHLPPLFRTVINRQPQDVSKMEAEVRLGKVNNNICASEPDTRKSDFEKIYAIYPKKKGKQRAYTLYCQWLKGKVVNGEKIKLDNRQMYIAVRNYVNQQNRENVDMQYWKNFDTLMGQSLLDYVKRGEDDEQGDRERCGSIGTD